MDYFELRHNLCDLAIVGSVLMFSQLDHIWLQSLIDTGNWLDVFRHRLWFVCFSLVSCLLPGACSCSISLDLAGSMTDRVSRDVLKCLLFLRYSLLSSVYCYKIECPLVLVQWLSSMISHSLLAVCVQHLLRIMVTATWSLYCNNVFLVLSCSGVILVPFQYTVV
jgi:hypothetical protein